MIKVNGQDFYWEPGLTVRRVIQEKNYTFPALMVSVNGVPLPEGDYDTYFLKDQDVVLVLHLMAGG